MPKDNQKSTLQYIFFYLEAAIFSPDIPSLEISVVGQNFAYFEKVENFNPEGFFPKKI
jgi:hypothetical protein